MGSMMKIGDKVSVTVCYCDPRRDKDQAHSGMKTVSALVTYINEPHRYFLAEYRVPGGVLRECFKF